MKIGSNDNSSCSGMASAPAFDLVTAGLRKQIQEVNKELQELSASKDLSAEEKTRKQTELSEQLNNLSSQLRQHQLNKRQEKIKEAAEKLQEQQIARVNEDQPRVSLSDKTVQAMAAAESAQETAVAKDGVRMDLSHEAMCMSNAIKREELDGGVSSLRKELNSLYGQIGDLAGEVTSALQEGAQALEDIQKDEADHTGTASEQEEQESTDTEEDTNVNTETAAL